MSVFRSLLALSAEGNQRYYPESEYGSVYIPLEYIHFTGTQYINTQCALWADKNWKMEFTFSIDRHYNYNNMWGFDAIESLMYEAWVYSDATYYTRIGASNNSDKRYIGTFNTNTKYKVTHDNTGTSFVSHINDVQVQTYSRCNTASNYPVCFGHRREGQWFIGKCYGIKFWSNGEIVRDMVPAMMKDTKEVGLYDIVNDVFYPNVGTGTFDYKKL